MQLKQLLTDGVVLEIRAIVVVRSNDSPDGEF